MLLPRRSERTPALELAIAPGRLALARGDAELRRLAPTSPDAAELGGLAARLATSESANPVRVVLEGGLARLLLLPWLDALSSESRWKNYAASRFEQTFGESLEAWDLQFASDWPGRDRLAAAWPAPLRTALAACPNVRSVRLAVLEHLGALLAREPAFSGCLAEIGSAGATLLLLVRGRVLRARWRRAGDTAALGAALRSEWAATVDRAGAQAVKDLVPTLALVPTDGAISPEAGAASAVLAEAIGATRTLRLAARPGAPA